MTLSYVDINKASYQNELINIKSINIKKNQRTSDVKSSEFVRAREASLRNFLLIVGIKMKTPTIIIKLL